MPARLVNTHHVRGVAVRAPGLRVYWFHMKKADLHERQCREMRAKYVVPKETKVRMVETEPGRWEPTIKVSEAAARLGVSNSTARRLLKPDARRYRIGLDGPMFPGDKLKRGQRVRMAWIITESAIQRVISRMEGLTT